jgi:uncharacterized protein
VDSSEFTVIRDPLWNNIELDREALSVLDTEPFQRLRYVRQLGHAFLVYPGATHTRFEHALGTYHLTGRVVATFRHRGELPEASEPDTQMVRLAALLHDVGHYPFSHALEEAGFPHHETLARRHFEHPDLQAALDAAGVPEWRTAIPELISGQSRSPLAGLISGSLDLDKIEYLTRDARMCGVPYGAVDVDRLLHALTVVTTEDGRRTIGVREKGMSALESLLFARYQMYRNVYWHHAVRSATAMFKRLVRTAVAQDVVTVEWVAGSTDDALMDRLRTGTTSAMADRLYHRRLFKRAAEVPGNLVPDGAGTWIAEDANLAATVEDGLAVELGLEAGDVLLDFPAKSRMLAVDLPVLTRSGDVFQLSESDPRLQLPQVSEELHATARFARLFVATPPLASAESLRTGLSNPRAEYRCCPRAWDRLGTRRRPRPTPSRVRDSRRHPVPAPRAPFGGRRPPTRRGWGRDVRRPRDRPPEDWDRPSHQRLVVRIVGAAVDTLDPNDDDSDVVEPPAAVGLRHEFLHQIVGRSLGLEEVVDVVVLDHSRQTVRREKVHILRPDRSRVEVRNDFAVGANTARDDVAVRVGARFLGREVPGVDLLLHVGVVLGQLHERTVPQDVGPRIPHLPDQVPVPDHGQGRGRSPHPALVVFGERPLEDGPVGLMNGPPHPRGRFRVRDTVHVTEFTGHDPDRHFARHLAGRVPSHAVGDDEYALVRHHEVIVLIPGSDDSNIRHAGGMELHVFEDVTHGLAQISGTFRCRHLKGQIPPRFSDSELPDD